MLHPQDRMHLLDALRPPEGYELNHAVGTTYSLDLMALLTAPIAFTFFEMQDDVKKCDSMLLLEALRKHANRISIFCNVTSIHVPKAFNDLLNFYLEKSVFEVFIKGGSFHPKIWILRYTSSEGPIAYRLLCLSRNLTYDRSWDTSLILDGFLDEKKNVIADNNPLGDFIAALPDMTIRKIPIQAKEKIQVIQEEIRRVEFQLPEGFEDIKFFPLGLRKGAGSWPFVQRADRLLVVSPFLSANCLARLEALARKTILVSRLEELQKIPFYYLQKFSETYCLSPSAVPIEKMESNFDDELRGLHAKLYIEDSGWDSYVFTGSANATESAFKQNIEFLVGIKGKKSLCGIDAFMKDDSSKTGFKSFLEPFIRKDDSKKPNKTDEILRDKINETKFALVEAQLTARVVQENDSNFTLIVDSNFFRLPQGVIVRCWPNGLPNYATILKIEGKPLAVFSGLSIQAITSFFAFEVVATLGDKKLAGSFLRLLPLEDEPQNREKQLLQLIIKNEKQFIKLLWIILIGGNESSFNQIFKSLFTGTKNPGMSDDQRSPLSLFLFEPMVQALACNPHTLDEIKKVIDDVYSPEKPDLMPEGFLNLWEPIWSTRLMIKDDNDRTT